MKYLLLLVIPFILFANYESEYQKMTKQQKALLQKAYELGKNFDAGYTLAAISWKESEAGLYNINVYGPACGPFHALVSSVMARHTYNDTPFMHNVVCQMLISNIDYAAAEALSEIEYWYTVHKGDWNKVWASYRKGWSYDSKTGQNYAKAIKNRIIVLKKYLKE